MVYTHQQEQLLFVTQVYVLYTRLSTLTIKPPHCIPLQPLPPPNPPPPPCANVSRTLGSTELEKLSDGIGKGCVHLLVSLQPHHMSVNTLKTDAALDQYLLWWMLC